MLSDVVQSSSNVSAVIFALAWFILSQTHVTQKSFDFSLVFPNEQAILILALLCPFQFAAGLLLVLRSPVPPTIAWFKSIPLITGKLWAVYLLVLEKAGHRSKIYVGSGRDFEKGYLRRMQQYDARIQGGSADTIPSYVEEALIDGYQITHKATLAWAPIPLASEKSALTAFLLLLETVFCLSFLAMLSSVKDYHLPAYRWRLEDYTYAGCCTHFSINEGFVYDKPEEHLTREEINQAALERKQAKSRQYIANKGEGVHSANTKAYGDKALEEQTHECKPCGLTFRSNAKKLEHEGRSIHKRKVAGIKTVPKGRPCKSFYCDDCQWMAPNRKRLETHLAGPRHAKHLRNKEIASKRNA